MNKKNILGFFSGIVSVAIIVLAVWFYKGNEQVITYGSINDANGYYSTTTDATWNGAPFYRNVKSTSGILGSVIISRVTTGTINIYDGTTTDATKRTIAATTTLASFAASTVAGTYIFDSTFSTGLIIETPANANLIASSTVTWR